MDHLVDVNFQRRRASPGLRDVVCWYWQVEAQTADVQSRYEFLHSMGRCCLIFNWGAWSIESPSFSVSKPALIGGGEGASRILINNRLYCFGVLLTPWGLSQIFDSPIGGGSVYELNAICAHAYSGLSEALYEAPGFHARCDLIESHLQSRFKVGASSLNALKNVCHRIHSIEGNTTVGALAESMGMEKRQVERLFARYVGLTPKRYANLCRVEAARYRLKNQCRNRFLASNQKLEASVVCNRQSDEGSFSLASIALDCGFSDQAHFNRAFKSIVRVTPGEYIDHQMQRFSRMSADANV